ncbi:MAG: cytochrome c [Armatimonadetes bacterium]|nr:cytochrome c [Armatimonadota bacterium]
MEVSTDVDKHLLCRNIAGRPAGACQAPDTSAADAKKDAAGQAAYERIGCGQCHGSLKGGGGRAPNLSKVGADPQHTVTWLADQIRTPQTHKPGSAMPSYGDQIPDADVDALSSMLSRMK